MMRTRILATTACGLLALGGITACGEQGNNAGGGGAKAPYIGVILPDSKSSVRWETADRKYLAAAFDAAGVKHDIQNAQDDKNAFQTIAEQMITKGVNVLMIVNLDSGTGKAVLDKAKQQGVATIDYDRLTLGGSASYYVSFDNVAVGKLQGEGLVKCLTDKKVTKPVVAYLNGSPTDNNATLFKQGYDSVLKPKFDGGEYTKGPDQAVPGWNNTTAGTIFEGMMTQTGGKIDGVLAANDGLGNAAISVLKRQNLKLPVTGQDATAQGLQNILAGDQCMTVYKAVKKEADEAAALAIGLATGKPKQVSTTLKDPESGRDVPSVLLTPVAITFDTVKDVVADGYVTKAELCTAEFAAKCEEAGVK
jgi:D-xylose transport system substrate-binding protein